MRKLPLCASLIVGLLAGSSAATTSIATSALGLSSTLGSGVAPVAAVSGSTSPGFALADTLPFYVGITDLGGGAHLEMEIGSIATSASADGTTPADTSTGSASSSLNTLGLGLASVSMGMETLVLSVIADSVQASTTAARLGNGSSSLAGSSQFTNLSISLGGMSLITLAGSQSVAANLVVIDAAGLTITLNEQVRTGTLGSVERLITSAIAIRFDNYSAGGQSLSGLVTLGRVQADLLIDDEPVPEPTTWLQMLAGFGLIGSWQRRQRRTAWHRRNAD